MPGDGATVDVDRKVLLAAHALEPHVRGAADGAEQLHDLVRLFLQDLDVVPEDLDGNVRPHAGDQLVDPIGDRLGHHDLDAGQNL